jgi:hypothetical protein
MLNNVTNRYFVPAPRSMLDPVMPCGERKSNGSGLFLSLTNDATKSEKASTLTLG